MVPLPIDAFLPQIIQQLRSNRCLVIVAEPGAGKTTRVPPAILRAGLLGAENPNLVMLQPRRVAARAAAMRIADENGVNLGEEVGYHIRFEKRIGPHTRLRVLTEGILTRQMLDDPFLETIGCVILDEFHERSLHTDMAIVMLREMQQAVRGDLHLVVMSATLEAEAVAKFLGDCPIVRVPGRTFPVEIEYQPHGNANVIDRAVAAIEGLFRDSAAGTSAALEKAGDLLVFLPGAEEIRRTAHRLESLAAQYDLLVLPLHGSLPGEDQMLALRPANRPKIVLATNIAETSLTIDGITRVIDCGLARVPSFDDRRGLDRLELKRISKASATQRAGRAGRTAPGKCIRLWSAKEQHELEDFESPEIRRVDLSATVLDLHAWGKPDARSFGWFEAPVESAIVAAERLLEMLSAVDPVNGALTATGRRLMKLPVHPRLGRLLIAAADGGYPTQGAAMAALLSEKDFVRADSDQPRWQRHPKVQGDSDLLHRMELLEQAERERFSMHLRDRQIDPILARQVARARDEFERVAKRIGQNLKSHRASSTNRASTDELLKLPLLAYPDRVCRRRGVDRSAGVMVGGGGVRLSPESIVRDSEFFLALDARRDPRAGAQEAQVRIASAIRVEWLFEIFPEAIERRRRVIFDADRQRVVGLGEVFYRDLLLSEDRDAAIDPEQAAAALAEALRPRVMEIFEGDEKAAAMLARLALLRQWMPEHPWPVMDEKELAYLLGELCAGKRSAAEVRAAPLAAVIENLLVYPLDRLLIENAPESIEVPSGNRIRLDYRKNQPPVLAARLQELFGWTDTPRIAGGRVAVVVHLLGPNYRPVQITDDLKSFWTSAYFQVRKDLRVRYPKHSWPENPLTAKAEAKGKRRG